MRRSHFEVRAQGSRPLPRVPGLPGAIAMALVAALTLSFATGCGGDPDGDKGAGADASASGDKDTGGGVGPFDSQGGDKDTTGSSEGDSTTQPDTKKERKKCEAPGTWGCACKTGDDCDSNYCIEDDAGFVCTETCTESCPAGWQCRQASGADAIFICLPQFASLCRPCTAHKDCASQGQQVGAAKCVPLDMGGGFTNGSFCGAGCDAEAPCPEGFSCKQIGLPGEATVGQCMPDNNACTCSEQEKKLALSTPCQRVNEFGTCTGQRKCSAEGLTLCSAAVPAAETCDGVDNDCDGETDEVDAVGCKVYFVDNDGDGAGTGTGTCLCNNPGAGYASVGGDCNDIAKAIAPGAKEVCNDLDDNCNGKTDESGASGCAIYYKDKDGDLYGDPDDAACVCPSKKTADLIKQAGDCDDTNDKIKPGATESCNKIDDNCNGKTDEEDADGCKLYYIDIDKDLYGPSDKSKCLCGADALYTATKPGDCDDNNKDVKPTQVELCNDVDDDCNGTKDDGDAAKSCPKVSGVEPACKLGKCTVGGCPKGYFDVDGQYANGCECQADLNYGQAAASCKAALDLGQIGDAAGTTLKMSGNIMPGETGDWFKFKAVDNVDVKGCDSFNVRVRFLKNFGNTYEIDLYRGSCAGADQLCVNETDVSWGVNFSGKPPFGPGIKKPTSRGDVVKSPKPEVGGECKCSTANGKSGPGAPGMNQCTNNTSVFWVRVHLAKGKVPACVTYTIEVSNGNYPTTGTP